LCAGCTIAALAQLLNHAAVGSAEQEALLPCQNNV